MSFLNVYSDTLVSRTYIGYHMKIYNARKSVLLCIFVLLKFKKSEWRTIYIKYFLYHSVLHAWMSRKRKRKKIVLLVFFSSIVLVLKISIVHINL